MAWINRAILVVIILFTAIQRWRMNATEYLTVGVDGTYYPLQVRSLIENWRLGYPDMPLVFFIEALVSKFFHLFGMPLDEAILFSVKFVDSFIPPLVAIPVFMIADTLSGTNKKTPAVLFIVLFSILNIFPLGITGNFTKNAVAMLALFFNLYYTLKFIHDPSRKSFVLILLTILFCGLTHFGSLAILLLYDGLIFLSWILSGSDKFQKIRSHTVITALLIFIILLFLLAFFDPERLKRMLTFPFRLFEAPMILFLINGFKTSLEGPRLVYLVLANLLSLMTLFWLFNNRKIHSPQEKGMLISSSVLILILASPFIGFEWEERLLNMSYVPVTMLFLVLLSCTVQRWIKYSVFIFCFGFVFFPFVRGLPEPHKVCISREEYEELTEINRRNFFTDNAMILARQDLRMIVGWIFHSKTAADYYLTKDDFTKYDAVFILKQKESETNKNESPQFKEPFIPLGCSTVYQGSNFEIFRLSQIDSWNIGVKQPMKIFGKIRSINGRKIIVQNGKVCRPVTISHATLLYFDNNQTSLLPEMQVQVWGTNTLFDLTIDATLIQASDPE